MARRHRHELTDAWPSSSCAFFSSVATNFWRAHMAARLLGSRGASCAATSRGGQGQRHEHVAVSACDSRAKAFQTGGAVSGGSAL